MTRVIDAHQHFWKVSRGDYHWMPASGVLHKDYLPPDLAPLKQTAEISGTILVQAAQTVAETQFQLDLASEPDSHVLGVVGWVALDQASASADLEQLAAHPKMVSVRPMLHDLEAADWITQRQVINHLQHLPQLGLCFDILSYPLHLPYAYQAIEQVPDLKVVINHLSKPRYRDPDRLLWQRWMQTFAQRPNTYCKLSGMVTEVGPDWTPDDFRWHAHFTLETFGPDRVMFGSDWPVCLQAASYAQVVQLAQALTAQLNDVDHAAVWSDTAAHFYNV